MKRINRVLVALASLLAGAQTALCQPSSPAAASTDGVASGAQPRRSLAVNLGVNFAQNLANCCAVNYAQDLSTNSAVNLALDLSTNLAVDFSENLATNLAVNYGQDLSTPTLDYWFPALAAAIDWSKMSLPEADHVESQ